MPTPLTPAHPAIESVRRGKTALAQPVSVRGHVLVVHDDANVTQRVVTLLADQGYSAATASCLHDARRQMALQPPKLLLLGPQLPDGNGLTLLDDPSLDAPPEVLMLPRPANAQGSLEGLLARVRQHTQRTAVPACEAQTWRQTLEATGRFGALVGRSLAMQEVYEQIACVAPTSVTVFVTGESGTGKELVARAVHDLSARQARPFLAVNCGAISPHLIESEIFGHERGSFTGAERQHQGFFERAHGGTLFLDEITEMPSALQVKLLRVLESGSFMRVGSSVALDCDVRVVAATNRDLAQAVGQGLLREDLMYRLNVFPIALPPLRDRAEDLPLLVDHLLQQIGQREGHWRCATPQALVRLTRHTWPGNVRELRNALQRAWVMATGDTISERWLP